MQAKCIWLILGSKLGDNAQVKGVAELLAATIVEKQIVLCPGCEQSKPPVRPTLDHIDRARSDPLTPPWPDLIITSGRRMAMVAQWVARQSGRLLPIVLVGRPKRQLDRYALIIASEQYRLPRRGNVLYTRLPLFVPPRQDQAFISSSSAGRPPITALLIGGATAPYRLDGAAMAQLWQQLKTQLSQEERVVVSTSRRTAPAVVAALERLLPPTATLYRYGIDPPEANPYRQLLASANRFVVTGDSLSMLLEVAALGRPLAIYPLPLAKGVWPRCYYHGLRWLRPRQGPGYNRLGELLYALGMIGCVRDLTIIHQRLYQLGYASPLSQGFSTPEAPLTQEAAWRQVRQRLEELLTST